MRVLLVEDEPLIALWATTVLTEAGYTTEVAATKADGERLALASKHDLILLDINLPDGSGLDVLSTLRRSGSIVPTVIMTGRDDDADVIAGLNTGADDYLVKPVSEGVFLARIRAVLRRSSELRRGTISFSNITLDRLRRAVTIAQRQLSLTPKEFALLENFMLHPGEPLSRTALLEHIWGIRFEPGTNVVDATISRLRQKLADAGAIPTIRSVRRIGFTLICEP